MQKQSTAEYRKSSFSDERKSASRCVEVAIEKNRVLVRHSRKQSVSIEFSLQEWVAFIRGVKQSEFDLTE